MVKKPTPVTEIDEDKQDLIDKDLEAEQELLDQQDSGATDDLEVKQGVVRLSKSGGRLRVAGMRGKFGDATFGDDHVSLEPVSDQTRDLLRSNFPEAEIEEVEDADQ